MNLLKIAVCLFLLSPALYAAPFECPQKPAPGAAAAEQAEDCPWAGVARLLREKADKNEQLGPVFTAHIPALLAQLDRDRGNSAALKLWGESINYDELAGGVIVHPGILRFIASRAGTPGPRDRLMHAGLEHTYGYLFSLLPTNFGFKRARWVRPDIESGLNLQRGSAGPSPSEGTLFSNITCLAGNIALRDDAAASALLDAAAAHCAAPLKSFSVRKTRLSETVELAGGRRVVLRTDFVPFTKPAGGNAYLLVYSVYDSAPQQAYLISAFPVASGFVQNALKPAGLGPNKPVQTRYNAFVEGVTGAGKLFGKREVSGRDK
ncbi:MAG: hypothetical protein A3J79_09125 [Elusimicrobia bacterium RIFOXYB2_FULL_62_6]|nr:MAG: hypothetical protein A3J79_09125 [Elusimicrobia bacterium RIFOXYB2_FULL_62_6]